MIKIIFFDFDGTLADSHELIFKVIKKNMEKENYFPDGRFKSEMGDLPLRRHLKSYGVKDFLKMSSKINEDIIKVSSKVKLVKDIKELAKIDREMVIVSNNNEVYLEEIVKKHKLKFFSEIYSGRNYAKKSDLLKKLMKLKQIKPEEAIYVGDKAHDAVTAREAGCYSAVICQKESWSTPEEIVKAQPDFIVSKASELRKVLEKLDSVELARV